MIVDSGPTPQIQEGRERQEALGQFLTPVSVANFMASLYCGLPREVRLIDAGAGAGALTAALVRRACLQDSGVQSIHAAAYEVDTRILPALRETLEQCETLCQTRGITFRASIHHADFIQEMGGKLAGDLFSEAPPVFNVAIANPPYRKIHTTSRERLALRSAGLETSNLYAGFVGLLARLLEKDGQLVAITPRSFCNGPYFQPFREDFLRRMELLRLHVFESRAAAFRDDAVLQENIIFHARKGNLQPESVTVSSSSGEPGDSTIQKDFPFSEIVHANDAEKFIHIPADTGHASAKARLAGTARGFAGVVSFAWPQSLHGTRSGLPFKGCPAASARSGHGAAALSMPLQRRHRALAQAGRPQAQRHPRQRRNAPVACAVGNLRPDKTIHFQRGTPPTCCLPL
jgi:adenine-specific DNA-methyltransferase